MFDATQANLQASEYKWDRCYFTASGSGACKAGIKILTTGNCKNFTVDKCFFNQCDYGFYQPTGSGTTDINDCFFTNIGFNAAGYAIYIGSIDACNVRSFKMENGNTGFTAGAVYTANGGTLHVDGGYCAGTPDTDDVLFRCGGPSTIGNFDFQWNERAGSNTFKIKLEAPTSGGTTSLLLHGCSFKYNTTVLGAPPIYDNSGNELLVGGYGKEIRTNVACIGNKQGLRTFTIGTDFPNISGRPWATSFGGIIRDDLSTGVTAVEDGEGRYKISIPHTAWSAAALTKSLNLGQIGPNRVVESVVMNTSVALAGITGPVTVEVGNEDDPDGFLVSSSVSAGVATVGRISADLGADLLVASRPHPAGWATITGYKYLTALATSASGNLNGLSAGTITIVITFRYIGP